MLTRLSASESVATTAVIRPIASLDLSVVIPALNEGPNLAVLLPWLHQAVADLAVTAEIIVVTRPDDFETAEAARNGGAKLVTQKLSGYGGATIEGFSQATGDYVLTMDADLSHRPDFIDGMWSARHGADITVASRYIPGGSATMPKSRFVLSRILNVFFRRGIAIAVRDLSSGFRLYKRTCIAPERLKGMDFDVLEEVLVKAICDGWTVQEVPFAYHPREHGTSSARVLRLGRAYLRSFWDLWKLRNSIAAADYDYRAYDSPIPLQRYWQRKRCQITRELVAGQGPVLDVGCGSSRILEHLPEGSVALDILARKLRYNRRFSLPMVHASGFDLPFPDRSFSCVLSSQVIEHVPKDSTMIEELCRVLRPGGRLILGTPDYSRKEWVYIEKIYGKVAPGAYADEHISHYTKSELLQMMEAKGFAHEETRYILRGELIMAFRKNDATF